MTPEEKNRIEAAGYTVGDTQQFLGLTDEEMKLIDLRIALVRAAKAARKKAGLTQADIAKRIGSSQPRVAAVERFRTEPSLDLVIRCLYAAGGDLQSALSIDPKAKVKVKPSAKSKLASQKSRGEKSGSAARLG